MSNIAETATFDVLKHDLSRFLPIRIVLKHDPDTDTYQGLCEESFSLGYYPKSVRIWWSGRAYSFLGEHILDGLTDAIANGGPGDIIYDPLSEDCPVEIDWEKWLSAETKFGKRNAFFRKKS